MRETGLASAGRRAVRGVEITLWRICAWCCCGILYGGLEILWRGYTHWTMLALAAGISIPLDIANDTVIPWRTPLWVQAVIGGSVITAAEFAVALGEGEDITSGGGEYKAVETFNDGNYEIPYYKIDPIAVTAENMDEVIIDGGFHTREDVYLNIR